jgi:DNA helicase-2/ATP-dependent DNA helicase PcrA
MFGDGRFSLANPWGLHRVALNTSDIPLRDRLKEKNLHTRAGRRNTWRIESSRLHYSQGLALAQEISREAGDLEIQFSAFLLKEGGRHDFHPVSHLREGMWIPVFDGKSVIDDEIESVHLENFSGDVYDLDVADVHNYIANRLVVHNCVYVWRGADIRNILEFEKEYPEAKVVKLEQNYRSTKMILDAAWNVVQHNHFRKEKKLWTEKTSGDPISATEFADEREEALAVASAIHQKVRSEDYRYADFSIFYRINAQSRVLEDALRRLEIPYKIIGAVRFYDRAEVKNVIAYLRVIVNPADTLSLKRIFNIPARALGKTTLEAIEKFAYEHQLSLFNALERAPEIPDLKGRAKAAAAEFHALLSTFMAQNGRLNASEMTHQILEATGYLKELECDDDAESQARAANIREFVNAVDEYLERSEDKSTAGFLEQVSLVADTDEIESGPNYVTLMTVHLAKGLEFPSVFLTGMEEGLFPIGESDFSQEDLEEERRLCYVGMTRAKNQLHITWAASRRLFGHSRWNAPSRFIEEAKIETDRQASAPTMSAPKPRNSEALPYQNQPIDETSFLAFSVGSRVRHPEFGSGKVMEKSGTGDSLKVVVLFDNGQWKKLLVKYAGLEKVQ